MNSIKESSVEDLKCALKRQAALLREIDHRVMNNLQLVSTLLLLQSRRSDGPARETLGCVLGRVNAIAAVQRQVYRTDSAELLDLAALAHDMVGQLAAAAGRRDVVVDLDLEPVIVTAPQGAPLALLINELVGNALLHAFPNARRGALHVSVRNTLDGYELAVSDDGVGRSETAPAQSELGLTIVSLLCQQLHARLDVTDAEPGVRVSIQVSTAAPALAQAS
ncbi:MAG: sensor histidine kinase [Phenylobacterium sp.]